jgi:hypothetical protein
VGIATYGSAKLRTLPPAMQSGWRVLGKPIKYAGKIESNVRLFEEKESELLALVPAPSPSLFPRYFVNWNII